MEDATQAAPKKARKPRTRKLPRSGPRLVGAINYTIAEVEEAAGWSHNKVYELIAAGKLRTYKHGKRRYATRRALEDCIAALEAEPAPAP